MNRQRTIITIQINIPLSYDVGGEDIYDLDEALSIFIDEVRANNINLGVLKSYSSIVDKQNFHQVTIKKTEWKNSDIY